MKIYLEPDISLICDKSKLDEKGCHGAPDWIIETVSPSSKRMDYYTKLSLYRAAGVREYWIVDPSRESVTVYFMEEDAAPVIYPFSDKIGANIYKELEIDVYKRQVKLCQKIIIWEMCNFKLIFRHLNKSMSMQTKTYS